MSFPGHAKSFKFDRHRVSTQPNDPNPDQWSTATQREPITHQNHDRRLGSFSSASNRTYVKNADVAASDIKDDCENKATRHLWIGNTGEGWTKREVGTLLGTKGKIESIRIFNHQGGFMFVNYEKGKEDGGVCEGVHAAIAAWRDYHEKDIFHRGQPVWVRFTVPENVARKAKTVERNESRNFARDMSPKELFFDDPSRSGRPRFGSGTNGFSPPTGPRVERFSISAPTGPRAMRRSVSPPLLRRGDSYRPSERSVRDEPPLQCVPRRTSGQIREDDLYRPNYEGDRTAADRGTGQDDTSRRESVIIARASTNHDSNLEERGACETQEAQAINAGVQVWIAQKDDLLSQKSPAQDGTHGMEIKGLAQSLQQTVANDADKSGAQEIEVSIKGAAVKAQNKDSYPSSIGAVKSGDKEEGFLFLTTLYESRDQIALATPPPNSRRLKSPLDSVRATNDETGSVVSDLTTSSKTSSIRKRNCAKCEKPETRLSTLSLKCSLCPRRFHSACANSSFSATGGACFTCGRCLRKQKTRIALPDTFAPSNVPANDSTAAVTTETTKRTENVPPTSSPEFVNNHQNVTAHIAGTVSPQMDGASASVPRPDPIETASGPASKVNHETSHSTAYHDFIYDIKENLPPTGSTLDHCSPLRAGLMTQEQNDNEEPQAVAEKYKREVTCPWWEKGDCRRREDDCMFAHEYTGIGTPRGPLRNFSKSWTCYRWKFAPRGCSDKDCQYAHQDTGLYLGSDGWPRKKHLTCFYWRTRGHCGKHEDDCIFTHRDTGFMAEQPAGFVPMPVRDSYRNTAVENSRKDQQLSQRPLVIDINTQQPQRINDDTVITASPVSLAPSINGLVRPVDPPQPVHGIASRKLDDEPAKLQGSKHTVDAAKPADQQEVTKAPSERPKQLARPGGRKPGQPPGDHRKLKQQASFPQVINTPLSRKSPIATPVTVSGAADPETKVETLAAPFPTVQATASRHASTRKCKFCGKKTFPSDICSSCQDPSKRPALEKAVDGTESATAAAENAPTENAMQHDNDAQLDSLISEEFDDLPMRDESPPKVLKRASSGSNMFLPNKRQRPNPNPMSAGPASKMRVYGTTIYAGRLDIQTLVQQAKAGKAAEQNPSIDADQTIDAFAVDKLPETPASPEKRSISSGQAQYIRPSTPTSIYSPPLDITELNISPVQALTTPRPSTISSLRSARAQEQQQLDNQLLESTQTSTFTDAAANAELQKWIRTPGPLLSSRGRSLSRSSNGESDVPLAATFDARRQEHVAQISPSKNDTSSDRPLSTGQACNSCRQRRRKCLHKADIPSELDPERCYVDMKVRITRGGSYADRSFLEVQHIEKAATIWAKSQGELEPDIILGRKEPEERYGVSRSATSAEDIINGNLVASDKETEPSSRSSPPEDDVGEMDDHDKLASPGANLIKVRVSRPVVQINPRRAATNTTTQARASTVAITVTPKTSPSKEHGKTASMDHQIRQDLEPARVQETATRPPARLRLTVKSHGRVASITRLKERGIEFESSDEEDYKDETPQFGNPSATKLHRTTTQAKPIDPLLNQKQSRTNTTWPRFITGQQQQSPAQTKLQPPKLTKRQGLKNRSLLRRHQMVRNLQVTGNAHHEVDRKQFQPLLRATVQRKVPHDNASQDSFAPDAIMTKEEVMTFHEFLGVPRNVEVEPCLFGRGIGEGLAFREKVERDGEGLLGLGLGLGVGFVGVRNRRRVLEGEKWPVSER